MRDHMKGGEGMFSPVWSTQRIRRTKGGLCGKKMPDIKPLSPPLAGDLPETHFHHCSDMMPTSLGGQ